MDNVLPTEIAVLGWSVVLFLVYVLVHSSSATRDTGLDYNAGPRDEEKPKSVTTNRLERAKWNFLETYPAFVALALGLAASGRTGGWAATGAVLWIVSRVLYLPLYAFGVPYVRSIVWGLSILGLLLMLGRLLF